MAVEKFFKQIGQEHLLFPAVEKSQVADKLYRDAGHLVSDGQIAPAQNLGLEAKKMAAEVEMLRDRYQRLMTVFVPGIIALLRDEYGINIETSEAELLTTTTPQEPTGQYRYPVVADTDEYLVPPAPQTVTEHIEDQTIKGESQVLFPPEEVEPKPDISEDHYKIIRAKFGLVDGDYSQLTPAESTEIIFADDIQAGMDPKKLIIKINGLWYREVREMFHTLLTDLSVSDEPIQFPLSEQAIQNVEAGPLVQDLLRRLSATETYEGLDTNELISQTHKRKLLVLRKPERKARKSSRQTEQNAREKKDREKIMELNEGQLKVARVRYGLIDKQEYSITRREAVQEIYSDELAKGKELKKVEWVVRSAWFVTVDKKLRGICETLGIGTDTKFPLDPERLEALSQYPNIFDFFRRLGEVETYQGLNFEQINELIGGRGHKQLQLRGKSPQVVRRVVATPTTRTVATLPLKREYQEVSPYTLTARESQYLSERIIAKWGNTLLKDDREAVETAMAQLEGMEIKGADEAVVMDEIRRKLEGMKENLEDFLLSQNSTGAFIVAILAGRLSTSDDIEDLFSDI